jgi:hypothetical protein
VPRAGRAVGTPGLVEAAPEAVGIEPGQQGDEALALASEEDVGGHAHLVEEDLVVVDLAGEALDGADVHAGVRWAHEHGSHGCGVEASRPRTSP